MALGIEACPLFRGHTHFEVSKVPLYTGFVEIEKLSDKIHRSSVTETRQVSLFSQSMDSLLYQEMLSYKASKIHKVSSLEESDWEVLSGDNYDGDSEASSLHSDEEEGEEEEEELTPTQVSGFKIKHLKPGKRGSHPRRGASDARSNGYARMGGEGGSLEEDVKVDYHTPKLFTRSFEERKAAGSPTSRGSMKMMMPRPISPKISVLPMKSSSMELLSSPSALSDEHGPYSTPVVVDEDSSPSAELEMVRRLSKEERRQGRHGSVRASGVSMEMSGHGMRRSSSLLGRGEKGATPLGRTTQGMNTPPSSSQ